MKQSMITIHGQDFIGDSSTCYKILDLMQEIQPVGIVYDFDAAGFYNRKLYYRTRLECTQTAVNNPMLYSNRVKAEEARDEAEALRAGEAA